MNHPIDEIDGRRTLAADVLLARLGIRADRPGVALAARVIDALACGSPDFVPRLSHDDAVAVGLGLARQWRLLIGGAAPPADDLVWADLVQFVLRQARDAAADGAGQIP